jgi:hypothetical protein
MRDGGLVVEGALRDHGDLVAMEGQDPQVLESGECAFLIKIQISTF